MCGGCFNGPPKLLRVFKVLPMVPMIYQYRSRFYQWYHCNTIGANGNANGTIGSPSGTIGRPMVPLATIGKITNGTIGRTPNRAIVVVVVD